VNIFIADIQTKEAILNIEESFHCTKVLRYKIGQKIKVTNGQGIWCEASLTQVHEKQCKAEILVTEQRQKRAPYLHLAIAPTKQIDRIEWMLEKCVELGIEEISFLQCHNSERTVVKKERLEKIIESAFKQSLQAYLPKVNELIKFNSILEIEATQKLIAHCESSEKIHINTVSFNNHKTLVLIGPEGDFSSDEILQATHKGFTALNLGTNRLRTETAGLMVCAAAAL
jgi:16S rRNA (uracil1498-N3)-methyltransferase